MAHKLVCEKVEHIEIINKNIYNTFVGVKLIMYPTKQLL